jgi:hypothetical protein
VHHAGAQAADHTAGALDVGRLDVAGEAVVAGVGQLDGVVLVAERCHAEHRPEDLLAEDAHLGGHVGEDGGPDEEALVEPVRPPEAADDELIRRPRRDLDGLVVDLLRDEHTRGGVARLPGVVHALVHATVHSAGDVDVREHEVRRLAAELQRDALDGGRGGGAHNSAHRRRPGQRDHVDERVRRERFAQRRARYRDHAPAEASAKWTTAAEVSGIAGPGLHTDRAIGKWWTHCTCASVSVLWRQCGRDRRRPSVPRDLGVCDVPNAAVPREPLRVDVCCSLPRRDPHCRGGALLRRTRSGHRPGPAALPLGPLAVA